MARFDIRKYPAGGKSVPYVVDLQSKSLDNILVTRVVAPLRPVNPQSIEPERLCPKIRFDGRDYFLAIPELAAVPERSLGPTAGSVNEHHVKIVQAIDFLLQGF